MIYTIGHSTRAFDEFLRLLRKYEITRLGDIRTVPRSRRHPHFSIESLTALLNEAGIAYRHFPGLGGLRKPRRDSTNTAWRHEGFRGYADYMETEEFHRAVDDLIDWDGARQQRSGATPRTVIMCAEAVWWRCHRQLVADALVAKGIEVRHIMTVSSAPLHTLTDFAQVQGDRVTYRRLI